MSSQEHNAGYFASESKPAPQYIEKASLDSRIQAVQRLHDGQEHDGDHRLVVDVKEAEREYGLDVASALKTNEDGSCILWPQPREDPNDPLNWSEFKKNYTLAIISLATVIPDFSSSIGIASLFPLSKQFDTTVNHVNNLTSNWSIFLLGPGGVLAVILISSFGRLPVLFWSQVLGLGFLIGCTVAPTLTVFAVTRCLQSFFSTAPQVVGLYFIKDIFFWHQEARKVNIWTFSFVVSPFLGPFLFGFLVERQTWRWAYGIGCIYSGLVLLLIILFLDESMYDRKYFPAPAPPTKGLRYRIETLIGITGFKMYKILLSCIFMGITFGWTIGINVTLVIFLQTPAPLGYGMNSDQSSAMYLTPIVAALLGELAGHWLNDFVAKQYIKRHHGVFRPEARLVVPYVGAFWATVGLITIGASLGKLLSIAGVIFGWGMLIFGIMLIVTSMYAYCSDLLPDRQGEISALLNWARVLGGFAVGYYQIPWAERAGALQVFGVEAAIVVGITVLVIPVLQLIMPRFENQSRE
ncbi:putative transporter C794,04c [Schizosaccharomyces pombe 972h-] [Rhizoctonia solani]|uniref:Putative transporter C794,04c [Schizosaccharomyces pombe 972h-] n=1 Tax=Rhizoctonia solani TaxID=456999 RepID=A0A0K6FKT9_9AGAM|nr:putative transporter C794,04c [Schizosaccharomyces pombe 972h-] [Rhizoctonia solani]